VTRKWVSITEAFSDFNVEKVSEYNDEDFRRLMNNPNIIRHKRKLKACIENAKIMRRIS
jgi:DNA-3-methyladenine glycosylase I